MASRFPVLRVIAFVATLSVLTAEPISAFSCQSPDPWFLTTISLAQTPSLPDGVSVRVSPRRAKPTATEPPWKDSALNWIEVENATSQPLYVLEDADEYRSRTGYGAISWPEVDVGDVPAGMRPTIKLQDSRWYGWPTNCAVIKCETLEWGPGAGTLMITGGDSGISRGFQEWVPRRKNRPTNVEVPGPQAGVMTLSYGGRAIAVPFVVRYELNGGYDSERGTENCGEGLAVLAWALLLAVIAVIALPVLVLFRLISKRSHRAPA
jgi:hypothetical protein